MSTTTIATESITMDTPIAPAAPAERTPDLRELTLIEMHPDLTEKQIAVIITQHLKAIKEAHQPPTRPFNYIQFNKEKKIWELTVFKEATEQIIQQIREAELAVIGFSAIRPESTLDATKLVLSHKKELHRPDFSACVTFNPKERQWEFTAKTQEALDSLIADWQNLHDRFLANKRPVYRPYHQKLDKPVIRPYQAPPVPKFNTENYPSLNGTA